MRKTTLGAIACLGLLGCGGGAMPSAQMTESKAAIRAADELGAERYPDAALHLRMARDQVEEAERFIADREFQAARRSLERAEADAELAIELARAEMTKQQARDAYQRVQRLQQELRRAEKGGTT